METVIKKQLSDYIDNLQDLAGLDESHDSFVCALDHSYSGFCFFINAFMSIHGYASCDVSFIDFAFIRYGNLDSIDIYEDVDECDMMRAIISALADEQNSTAKLALLISEYVDLSIKYNSGNDSMQKQLKFQYNVGKYLASVVLDSDSFMDTYFDLMTA